MKMLCVDRPFPTNIAQWRIEEVKSFIKEMNADVMSIGSKDESHNEMCDYYGLNDYNILIFNPRWNNLNQYNKNFDGRKFNSVNLCDYVYSKEKTFDINKYDIIYHIFYSRYKTFNTIFTFPQNKQVIHLYPAGGYNKDVIINKDVNLITTQRYYTDDIKRKGHTKFIEVLGGSMLQKDSTYTPRQINERTVRICFSSAVKHKIGKPYTKGADIYISAVEKYKKLYKNDNVEFISVGVCPDHKLIKKIDIVPMEKLKKIYDTVDIYINPETGSPNQGWPLGTESVLRGSVLITTDPFNSIEKYPELKDKVIIVDIKDSDSIVSNIKKLYDDRILLNKLSVETQAITHDLFSFNNQQQKIFNYIDDIVKNNK